MNRVAAHLLTRLYPRDWRERYGEEFLAVLEDGRGGLRTSANVLWSALQERIFPTQGGNVDQQMNSFGAIIKRPSAFLPMAMSLTALTLVLVHIAMFGPAREADEGTTAHLWQLSWLGRCQYWRSSRSSGCRELHDRRSMYWPCKPERCSHPWSPFSCLSYE